MLYTISDRDRMHLLAECDACGAKFDFQQNKDQLPNENVQKHSWYIIREGLGPAFGDVGDVKYACSELCKKRLETKKTNYPVFPDD